MNFKSFATLLIFPFFCFVSQGQISNDYFDKTWQSDLSKVLKPDSIEDGDGIKLEYNDPYGFIDSTYQRFYIHISSITRIKNNIDADYIIKGKTKTGNNICPFTGSVKILVGWIDTSQPYKNQGLYSGAMRSAWTIYEDRKSAGAGIIEGKLWTNFVIDSSGNYKYDAVMLVADNFKNNSFEGKWTSYKTGKSKICNWGDFRIPNSGDLDEGVGEFIPNPKYLDRGWRSFYDSEMGFVDDPKRLAAEKKEQLQWWK